MTLDAFVRIPLVNGLAISLAIVIIGALVKKNVSKKAFNTTNFFLGIELLLVAYAYSISLFWDIAIGYSTSKLGLAVFYFIFVMVFLHLVIGFHQDWERNKKNILRRNCMLGLLSNGFGVILLVIFFKYIKI